MRSVIYIYILLLLTRPCFAAPADVDAAFKSSGLIMLANVIPHVGLLAISSQPVSSVEINNANIFVKVTFRQFDNIDGPLFVQDYFDIMQIPQSYLLSLPQSSSLRQSIDPTPWWYDPKEYAAHSTTSAPQSLELPWYTDIYTVVTDHVDHQHIAYPSGTVTIEHYSPDSDQGNLGLINYYYGYYLNLIHYKHPINASSCSNSGLFPSLISNPNCSWSCSYRNVMDGCDVCSYVKNDFNYILDYTITTVVPAKDPPPNPSPPSAQRNLDEAITWFNTVKDAYMSQSRDLDYSHVQISRQKVKKWLFFTNYTTYSAGFYKPLDNVTNKIFSDYTSFQGTIKSKVDLSNSLSLSGDSAYSLNVYGKNVDIDFADYYKIYPYMKNGFVYLSSVLSVFYLILRARG